MEIQLLISSGGYIAEVEVWRQWMVYDIFNIIENHGTNDFICMHCLLHFWLLSMLQVFEVIPAWI
jgi:hypothetical protein